VSTSLCGCRGDFEVSRVVATQPLTFCTNVLTGCRPIHGEEVRGILCVALGRAFTFGFIRDCVLFGLTSGRAILCCKVLIHTFIPDLRADNMYTFTLRNSGLWLFCNVSWFVTRLCRYHSGNLAFWVHLHPLSGHISNSEPLRPSV
jgi:hypothetical protein